MMSGPRTLTTTPLVSVVVEPPPHTLRLRLKPKAPATGYVDGAWWPRSRDLSAELPTLLAVLAIRPGRIERVTYNLTKWQPAVRRLPIGGHTVRLEGFRSQHPDTLTITGQSRQRLTLFVVPPESSRAAAHHTLMTSAQRDNIDNADTLLALSHATPAATPENSGPELTDPATQRWEAEGGQVR